MRRILLLVALLAALSRPTASAQVPALALAIDDPADVEVGEVATLQLRVSYQGVRAATILFTSESPDGVEVDAPGPATIQPGQTLDLAATIVARVAGDHQIRFDARENGTLAVATPANATIRLRASLAPPPEETKAPPTADHSAPTVANSTPAPLNPAEPPRDTLVGGGAPSASGPSGPAIAGGAMAGVGLFAWIFRRRVAWVIAILYARLHPSRALDHPRRRAILDLIAREPGVTLAGASRALGMGNGALRHHVDLLASLGALAIVPAGQERRLYPTSARPRETTAPLDERCLDALREDGPMTATELAKRIGTSRQAVQYHLRRLAEEGRVEREGALVRAGD